ncbi:MAG TPA: hypothetical protein VIT41_14005 [Microlunatus sp.]
MRLDKVVNDVLVRCFWVARRVDPLIRPLINIAVRPWLQALVQWNVRRRLPDHGLALAEERELPGESAATNQIIAAMSRFTETTYARAHAERAGNTKTYGVARAELTVADDLPASLRRGLFAEPLTYRAFVRFAGPGPTAPPDLHDNAIMSIAVKVLGVAGPKLLGEESATQDLLGISAPTFTTPDVVQNAILQREIGNGTPLFYFIRPSHLHLSDLIMQGLYAITAASPLQVGYDSCTPYLLGEGQAVRYLFRPRPVVPPDRRLRVPLRPGPDYLREAMIATLTTREVIFDLLVQRQTDPTTMPLEHAGVVWSRRRSRPVRVATLRLPVQAFDTTVQQRLADTLRFNPWHSLPEHRPLGNQNRARRTIYAALADVRQRMNATPHMEPTASDWSPVER